jgi:hypothetical protein
VFPEMVPKTISDSGSGSSVLFTCWDGSEALWSASLLSSVSAIRAAGAITTLFEGGEGLIFFLSALLLFLLLLFPHLSYSSLLKNYFLAPSSFYRVDDKK